MHRADIEPSTQTPLLLTGYGGFAISETPSWVVRARRVVRRRRSVRGRRTARRLRARRGLAPCRPSSQQAERLRRLPRRSRLAGRPRFHVARLLAIEGGSNGGLLMGAALTQRPDLARAVHCAVPLLDMIRFPQFLIARLWTDEYGDPDVAEEFAWLHAYSPYHHVARASPTRRCCSRRPRATRGSTRCTPARWRRCSPGPSSGQAERPVLLRQSGRSGHGQGKPASMRVREDADVLSFFCWQLGVETTLDPRL